MDSADIDTLLPLEAVSLDEPPTDKRACIEHVLDSLVNAERVTDREKALEALLAREEETSTGVGKGIGIPHAKTDAVTEPSLAFVRSSDGVDFDAPDDEPATLVFMILVPADGADRHLDVLSSLSRALIHDDVREALHDASDEETVRNTLAEAIA